MAAKKTPSRPNKGVRDHNNTAQVNKTVNELILAGAGLPKGKRIKYTPEIGAEICTRLASGESMNRITADKHMPHKSSVNRWIMFADDENIHKSAKLRGKLIEFRDHYHHARSIQAEHFMDIIPDIAQDGSADYKISDGNGGHITIDKDHINRSKLSVETLKWLSEVYLPKVQALKDKNLNLKTASPIVLQFDKQDQDA